MAAHFSTTFNFIKNKTEKDTIFFYQKNTSTFSKYIVCRTFYNRKLQLLLRIQQKNRAVLLLHKLSK